MQKPHQIICKTAQSLKISVCVDAKACNFQKLGYVYRQPLTDQTLKVIKTLFLINKISGKMCITVNAK